MTVDIIMPGVVLIIAIIGWIIAFRSKLASKSDVESVRTESRTAHVNISENISTMRDGIRNELDVLRSEMNKEMTNLRDAKRDDLGELREDIRELRQDVKELLRR